MLVAEEKKHSKAKELLSRYGMAILFVLPFVLFFLFFTVTPFVMGLVISFFKYDSANPTAMKFIGIKNYVDLFQINKIQAEEFWPAMGRTMLFAIVTVPIMIAIPLLLAVLVNCEPPGYKFFRALLYLPCILSISTAGILFVTIFNYKETGLINALFGTKINFLEDERLRFLVMILLSVWWQTGTNFVIFSAALKNVPKSLYEACDVDGGGKFSSFLHVTLPNIKPALSLCLFNTLIGYMNLYGQPTVIVGEINKRDVFSAMQLIQGLADNNDFSSLTGFFIAIAVVFGFFVFLVSILERFVMKIEKGGHGHERRYSSFASIEK